jgi:hypothetical protein
MMLREEVERHMGRFEAEPAKVGRRYHAAAALPPNAWRRSLKPWVALALGWVLGTLFGVVLVLVWEMTK